MAMTDWDDLDQFVGEIPDEDYERPDTLDANKANRMLRKLRRLQTWKQNTEQVANDEIARIAEWREGRTTMIGNEIGRLTAALEGYMRAVNRADGKVKTQNLPNGSLRLRAPRTRVVVDAPDVAINFLLHRVADRTHLAGDERDLTFGTIDTVLDALNAEPMLRLKLDVAGGEIGKVATKGEARGMQYSGGVSTDAPSEVHTAVLPDGAELPGVALHSFVDDTFTFTLNVDATPDAYGEDQTTEDEL